MTELSDAQLLRDYAEHGADAAFGQLVQRYTDLVFSAALRQVHSHDVAADVAQTVFTDLARKARPLVAKLPPAGSLVGWLYRSTRFAALNFWREERRRATRERLAMDQLLTEADSTPDWAQIQPLLDEAMAELSESDRDALLLRYFKNQDFRAIGQVLGVSDDAAQKRVGRALERLREFFCRRKLTVGAGGLVALISAHAVQAAPAGLAATITSAAVLAGAAAQTSTAVVAAKTIAMTTLQKTLLTVSFAAVVGAGLYQTRQTASLRHQVQTLQQQQAPLAEQLAVLQGENQRLSNRLAQAMDTQALSTAQQAELLKLRGKTSVAQGDARELAALKATLAQQTSRMPDYLTNAMAMGLSAAEKMQKKTAEARLARMKKRLNLTAQQEQAVREVQSRHIEQRYQRTVEAMTGKLTPQQQHALAGGEAAQEAEIKTLLSAEQLAAYPDFQQAEKITAATASAQSDAHRIAEDYGLSQEQQARLKDSFYQLNLSGPASRPAEQAVSQARERGDLAQVANLTVEFEKTRLEEKLTVLEQVLSPEQLNSYREEQLRQLKMSADAMKMFLPPRNTGAPN